MFEWSQHSEDAAQLVAQGELSYKAIATVVGITDRWLRNWRDQPEFAKRVEEHRAEYRELVRRRGISTIEHRVEAKNDRWRRMQQVIDERAVDKELAKVPGGSTGLVVITEWKQLRRAQGDDDHDGETFLPVHAVDTGLLKEIREIEKEAAQELGQWLNKSELTGKDGTPLSAGLEAQIAKVYGEVEQATEETTS